MKDLTIADYDIYQVLMDIVRLRFFSCQSSQELAKAVKRREQLAKAEACSSRQSCWQFVPPVKALDSL